MQVHFKSYLVVLIVLFSLFCNTVHATVLPARYGLPPVPESIVKEGYQKAMDSFYKTHPMLAARHMINNVPQPHSFDDKTKYFYLLLILCLFLGLIRYSDRRYFSSLWKAFWNPTLSNRQLKDQLQGATISNLLMNIFFTISSGSYLYFVVRSTIQTPHTGQMPASLMIVMLISGMMLIYLAKYAAIRFSGWAFRIEGVTDQYLFNVFLINKIIGISAIPFTILMAFANPMLTEPIIILSFVLIGLLLINRYTRSWQVFGSFFQYSKFHFFTYLCASELLPLALLMKLLVKGVVYY